MNPIRPLEDKRPLPDFSLLITRLEHQIIHQQDQARICQVLRNERIWKALNIDKMLKWASLAQMAGETETACRVWTHIHKTSPGVPEAWQNHLDLLSILGEKEKMARLLAVCRRFVDETLYSKWVSAYGVSDRPDPQDDIQAASKVFEALHRRRQAINRFLELFSGRQDCFARQWVEKKENKQGYVPIRRPLEPQDLEDHFRGLKTYGIYLLKSDGKTNTAVIDVDLRKPYRMERIKADEKNLVKRELIYFMERITELSGQAGLLPLIEFSGGKGYHFWYFFEFPVRPEQARSALESIRQSVAKDLSAFAVEVFPKQDQLKGKGLGNLVKLPLGVHRLTGKRSYFVKCRDRSVEAQLDFLSKVRPTDPEKLKKIEAAAMAAPVFIHPRWENWAKSYPELFSLERKCPPLAQLIAVCRNARTLSLREEKVLFQTIGFLPRAKTLLHYLLASLTDYNPHLVDYRLSRVRGTPLGCRRIHSLLNYTGDLCLLEASADYQHPLLHLDEWKGACGKKTEKLENLTGALENLKTAIIQAQKFLE